MDSEHASRLELLNRFVLDKSVVTTSEELLDNAAYWNRFQQQTFSAGHMNDRTYLLEYYRRRYELPPETAVSINLGDIERMSEAERYEMGRTWTLAREKIVADLNELIMRCSYQLSELQLVHSNLMRWYLSSAERRIGLLERFYSADLHRLD